MQDQCAWAIGNMAAGNADCRDVLRAKGAIEPLICLLKVRFSLYNIILCIEQYSVNVLVYCIVSQA